jgi:hypothetical protein
MTKEERSRYNHAYRLAHREQINAKGRIYHAANRERQQKKARAYYAAHRGRIQIEIAKQNRLDKMAVLAKYGSCCACCGETILQFLSLDHINGGGRAHRQRVGESGRFWKAILNEGYSPQTYRVLCFNCNMSLGIYGYCPHHPERRQRRGGCSTSAEGLPLFDQKT